MSVLPTYMIQTASPYLCINSILNQSLTLVSECKSEQEAAEVLGYTQVSWDKGGKKYRPDSANKYWAELTDQERAAAAVLGYTEQIWDKGGKKDQPDSAKKYWAELTSCGEDHPPTIRHLPRSLSLVFCEH